MQPQLLRTRRRDGSEASFPRTINDYEWKSNVKVFRVYRVLPIPEDEDWFELRLDLGPDVAQRVATVDVITDNNCEWAMCQGISEAILLAAADELDTEIHSSAGEDRSGSSEQMWRRFVEEGLAWYESDTDWYWLRRRP